MSSRKFLDARICTKEKIACKWANDPRYYTHKIISENMTIMFLKKRYTKLNKNFAIGFAILELSKFHMYDAYYNFFMPRLGDPRSCTIVLTDTDSLLLHIKGKTREEILTAIESYMDFSNYPPDHSRYNDDRKAVPGYFKDENAGKPLLESVALKSKCYVLRTEANSNKTDTIKCKGVIKRKCRTFTLDMYKRCIFSCSRISTEFNSIRANNRVLNTVALKKIALTSFDNKRWLKRCGIHSEPIGMVNYNDECEICPHESQTTKVYLEEETV